MAVGTKHKCALSDAVLRVYFADLSFIFSMFWFPICKIEIIAWLHYTKSLQR